MSSLPGLLAHPIPELVPVFDAREPLRVLIASLAPGGAERIVLEWLAAESARGRAVELAVIHARRIALAPPNGVAVRTRGREDPFTFVSALARDWRVARAPVSTHLIADELLAILWSEGVRTVPTVHNAREGWRNDAAAWRRDRVPLVMACAEAVRAQLVESGCRVPVVALRHRPCVGAAAFDVDLRRETRAELGVGPETFLVGAIGALKAQKDYPRAIEVLAQLCRRRDAVLVILGGILDRAGLPELERVMSVAVRHSVATRLRLPGFVPVIEPYLAACDAILNVSRFEGLSIAVQEALAAGLPVVATDVGGQREISHAALELLDLRSAPETFAARLARLPVRNSLSGPGFARAPRAWSLATAGQAPVRPGCDTLFVTANLNAGGAQRSLANLARSLAAQHSFALAVCGETTQAAFAHVLRGAGIELFRPASDSDALSVAESLLAHAQARGARNLCFWNVDPRVKLAVAKFAAPELRMVDVSPGAYAFAEMQATSDFAAAIAFSEEAYYRRLDVLVLKYRAESHPACRRVVVVPNAVAAFDCRTFSPAYPRFLVSGRIAPSKRLETVIQAFALIQHEVPCAELHVVGSVEERHADYAEKLLEEAAALRIRFRGACVDLDYLREPFTAAVILGTHQGSPNAALEAMAAAIPVIANDSGGTRELVVDGETGWLLPEDTQAEELANAMREVIAREAEAGARASRALSLVRTDFTLEAMAGRYLEILAAEPAASREKMHACNSDSVPAAPPSSAYVASPTTAVP